MKYEDLADTVYTLRTLAEEFAKAQHPAALEAHNALVAAQSYVAALAVEMQVTPDRAAAISLALENCRRTAV